VVYEELIIIKAVKKLREALTKTDFGSWPESA